MSFERSIKSSDSGNFTSAGEDSKTQSSVHKLEHSHNSSGEYDSGTRGLQNLTTDHNQDHRDQIWTVERSYKSDEGGSAQSKDEQSKKDVRGIEKSKPGENPATSLNTGNIDYGMSITGRNARKILHDFSKDIY